MPSDIPKAVLYYNPKSVWSAVALLGLHEKGYGADEVDLEVVDLASGGNYQPAFLRLNPKATVPTLVVPLQKTLSEDVESRYKAITESKEIAEFLDKSRSAQSRTNTTSDAPAPKLEPATIGFLDKSNEIIGLLHSEEADPNELWYYNARDSKSLERESAAVLAVLKGKEAALRELIGEAESGKLHVSEKTKQFWMEKKIKVEGLLDVYLAADKAESELSEEERAKREAYFATGRNGWAKIKNVLEKLEKTVIGPYALGDQFSIADLHLAAWLTRVVSLAKGSGEDSGGTTMVNLGTAIGLGRGEGEGTKVGRLWDGVRKRSSWQKVYGAGVF